MSDVIKIANCSGFYGDKLSAAREMVEGGPIDVLTGDWPALYNEVRAFRDACGEAHLKTIMATGELGTLDRVLAGEGMQTIVQKD